MDHKTGLIIRDTAIYRIPVGSIEIMCFPVSGLKPESFIGIV